MIWEETTADSLSASGFELIAWIERRSRRVGRVWRLLLRFARLPLALAIALPLAARATFWRRRLGLVRE